MDSKTSLSQEKTKVSYKSLEPTKYLRIDPDIIFGPTKPLIDKTGFIYYPDNHNPILDYWQQIEKKQVNVSIKVKQQYKQIVSWIKNGHKEWRYSHARANHIIEFAENYCKHSKGKQGGKNIQLELWEKAYLATVYGFIDKKGNRKHQKAVLIVGKKNGKSLLDSIMGLYALIGDQEAGPEVYAVATKKDQAKIVWQEAKSMVKKSPALRKRIKALTHELDSRDYNDGVFKALASDSDSMDGLNIHTVIMDEWHQWKNGRPLYDIMADGITARDQPLIIMTSTAGTIREDIFDQIYEEAEIQLKAYELDDGVIDDRAVYFIYELDKKSEWTDPNCWIKANPGLGTIKKLRALQDKVKRAINNSDLVKNLVCKEFNIRETSSEAWLSFDDLNNTAKFDIAQLRPKYGIGGSDLSSTTDLTCGTIIFMVPNDSHIYVKQMYWLPEELLEQRTAEDKIPYDKWYDQGLLRLSKGNRVHYKDVEDWFIEMTDICDIYLPYHGYDNWSSTYYVENMTNHFGQQSMEAVIQGKKTLSAPMKSLGADLKSKKIVYDNNPILKWCLANTTIDVDKNNNQQPVKGSSPRRRIDGLASLLNAYVVLERHYEDYINII